MGLANDYVWQWNLVSDDAEFFGSLKKNLVNFYIEIGTTLHLMYTLCTGI